MRSLRIVIACLQCLLALAGCKKSQLTVEERDQQLQKTSGVRSAPPYTLNIRFNGAIAFVPEEAGDGKHYKQVTALAVNAEDIVGRPVNLPPAATRLIPEYPLPLHFAFLRVKARNYCADAGASCVPSPQVGDADILLPLSNDRVSITDIATGGDIPMDPLKDIPDLSVIAPDYGKVCHGCVNPGQKQARRVAAVLSFGTGTFGADQSSLIVENKKPVQWDFVYLDSGGEKQTGVQKQQLYETTVLTAQVPPQDLMITLSPFADHPQFPERKFKLHPATIDAGVLTIELVNQPATHLLGRASDYVTRGDRISHYMWFYLLSNNFNPPAPPPIDRFPYPMNYNGNKGGDPYCSNGLLKP
jgi:hypothetical protein